MSKEKTVGKVLRIPSLDVKHLVPGLNFNKASGYAEMLNLIDKSTTERFSGEFYTLEIGLVVRTKTSNEILACKEGNRISIMITKPMYVEHDHKLGDLFLSQSRHLLHENFHENFVKVMPMTVISPIGIIYSLKRLILTSVLYVEDVGIHSMSPLIKDYVVTDLEKEIISRRNIINYPDVYMLEKLPLVKGDKDVYKL